MLIIKRSGFFSDSEIPKSIFYLGFALKLLAGFALTWIYTYYYTDRLAADIYKYFDDSKIMFDALRTNPAHFFAMLTGINENTDAIGVYYDTMLNWHKLDLVYNDNHLLIRTNTVLRFFSLGYFAVHTIALSFISFSGLVALFHLFKKKLNCTNYLTFFLLLLMPSLLFWTSGTLKDGLLLGLFGLFIYQFDGILNKGISISRIILLTITFFFLIQIKVYVFMIALPGIGLWLLLKNKEFSFIKSAFIWFGTYILFVVALGNLHHLFPQYNFNQQIALKQYHFKRLAIERESGSYIEIKKVEPTLNGVIKNSPGAFFTVLARPYLFESMSPLILLASLENTFIILSILVSLMFLHLNKLKKPDKLYVFSIVFLIGIFVLIGLVTPVMGAIVRYKTIALPFLIFITLYQINWNANPILRKLLKT
ncbi:MAG: hypothetical protein HKN75_08635 [Bacteroidia bacterium]|nr:hypothetical protein [Bacteroidia bacterium]